MAGMRVPFRTQMRDAAMTLLRDFSAETSVKLQLYPGRPLKLFPPAAFPDRFTSRNQGIGDELLQRNPTLYVVLLWGLFDSKDAVDQADRFLDGFEDWVAERFHAAGENTGLQVSGWQDDPNYIPDWVPPAEQRSYYATVVALEGLALD